MLTRRTATLLMMPDPGARSSTPTRPTPSQVIDDGSRNGEKADPSVERLPTRLELSTKVIDSVER